MKKILIFLTAILTVMSMQSVNRYEKPDFAYPKQVIKASLADLDRALSAGDGKLAVRSLINYELAQSAIDPDSLVQVLARIQSVTDDEKDPCIKSLLNTLLARIYLDIYQANRWVYDRRDLPATADSDNYTLWSGRNFREKILTLTRDALKSPEALQKAPLKDYDGIVDIGTHTTEFYPTLYDFITSQALSTLDDFSEAAHLFSINSLCRYEVYSKMKFNYRSPVVNEILDIYRNLLDFHRNDTAPFINCDIRRIDFIAQHVYYYEASPSTRNTKRELLLELYHKYENSPYATEILTELDYDTDSEEGEQLYPLIKKQLREHPGYFRNGCLENMLKRITLSTVNLSYNTTVTPGDTLVVKTTNRNTPVYEIRVYSVPYTWKGGTSYLLQQKNMPKLVKTVKCANDNSVPFKAETSEKIVLDRPGCYIIVPVIPGRKNYLDNYYEMVHCTNLGLQTAAYADNRWAYVFNPATGKPISVPASLTVSNYNGTTVSEVNTGKDATALLPTTGNRVYVKSGPDRYAAPCYIPYSNKPDNNRKYIIHGFTDLALYRPGDTVQWTGVVQSYLGREAKIEPGFSVNVTLRDANYQLKDSAKVVSDNFGRITGSFTIPDEGLTGMYSIQFSHPRSATRQSNYGTVNFTVSDYKLPTYKIEITDIMRDRPATGAVTLKGKVETYSGFPMDGCDVNVDLSVAPRIWWWRGANDVSFYSAEATTDSNGEFTVEFAKDLLDSSPIPDGIFNAAITATSSTGENQNTSKSFTTGRPYILTASPGNDIDVTAPISLNISLQDPSGQSTDALIDYSIIDKAKKTVAKGSFMSSAPTVDWSRVASGTYDIKFHTADSTLAMPVTVEDITLYKPTDSLPPVTDTPLWIPVRHYTLKDTRKTSVLYGVNAEKSYVHYAVFTGEEMLEQGWIETKRGLHRFEYTIPNDIGQVQISLSSTSDYRYAEGDVTVVRESSVKSISINIESFRDHITPGAEETWTFKVKNRDGKGVKSAVMLDMYCKALDKLAALDFTLNRTLGSTSYYNLSSPAGLRTADSYAAGSYTPVKCIDVTVPQFLTWGNPFYGFNNSITMNMMSGRAAGIRVRGTAMQKSYAAADDAANIVREHKEEVEEEVMADMAVPEAAAGATDGGNAADNTSDFEYRAAETPIAFFRPDLTTDKEGNLEFSFTAPNANTTWQLCAIAFTPDMLVSNMAKEIVSNKPVMVQPNMPRFLRNGDKAYISASVMNNTDTTAVITTTVEIFDPTTEIVTDTYTFTDTVAPHASAIVTTPVNAGSDTDMTGYRIKSSTDAFADGEQSIIPVLPSVQPVIETMPFYIAPDSTSFRTELPKMPGDARVTLQYCDNPVWYVVTALPGLRKDACDNALSASALLFSAAIAEGIMNTDPDIASALKEWSQSDRSDSTLVSMLERNQDLKTVLLNATPWVMDAKSDTERMTRLALLFDKDVIKSSYAKAVKQLALLEAGNGGWAWISQYKEPSSWITLNILAMTGRLKQLGFMPDNKRLDEMIRRGISYLDRQAEEMIKHNASATDITYVLVRDYYSNIPMSAGAKRLTSNTVTYLSRNWKTMDAPAKAIATLILFKHNYKTMSRNIIASLREFAVSTPENGMWWPSLDDMTAWSMGKIGATSLILDAFNTVDPGCRDIDLIRQWLILQKEAKDWGTSVTTSDVIASLLTSGSKWTVPASPAIISIGDTRIEPESTDRLLGYFRSDISSLHPSEATLSIEKSGSTPSWGAVYCQFKGEMTEIKAASCPEVSIDKQLYKRVNGTEGVEWIAADSITTGDIVQVNLTITVKRDMDYVAITDQRGACFQPVEQLPRPVVSEGIYFYRENRDSYTDIFVTRLPKGVYRLSYELYANNAGTYSSGIATLQSQYAPALSAHSSGRLIKVVSE